MMSRDKENSQPDGGNDRDYHEKQDKSKDEKPADSEAALDNQAVGQKAGDKTTDIRKDAPLEDPTTVETMKEKAGEEAAAAAFAEEDQDIDEADISEAVKKEQSELEDNLTDINSSLAQQISKEMETQKTELATIKKRKRLFKIQSGILLTLLCLIGFGFFFGFTKPGHSVLMSMGVNIGGSIWGSMTNKFDDTTDTVQDVDYLDEEDLQSTAPTIEPSKIVWPEHPGEGRKEEGVYNILLLGEEAIGMGDGRGHTDVMVIATLNTKNKTVKLTSLMRDMLVQIPGYQDNKLNSAYANGGLDLLYETIAQNFDIRLDGCVKVNFSNFEKIIDSIGGIELTLKQNEADYLNTTNYISKKQYRTLVAGKQLLNGNQVMGYVRVRKTSTITGHTNDYGRTDRHRAVLNAIYEKCRTMSKTDMLSMMFKFLPMLTTDISSDCFEEMLNDFLELGINTQEIQQLRIPADNTFQDNVKVRGMSVLIPDLEANQKILGQFIFGEGALTQAPTAAAAK